VGSAEKDELNFRIKTPKGGIVYIWHQSGAVLELNHSPLFLSTPHFRSLDLTNLTNFISLSFFSFSKLNN